MSKMMSKFEGVSEEFSPEVYIRLMRNLSRAFGDLVEYCEENGIDFQDFITKDYPFEHSLDEVAFGVMEWADSAEQTLDEV